jgi:hypothetical protein
MLPAQAVKEIAIKTNKNKVLPFISTTSAISYIVSIVHSYLS